MYKHLTQTERHYIWLRIANKISIMQIAKDLKIAKSTIYRELKRNHAKDKVYEPYSAQKLAEKRKSEEGDIKGLKN